GENEAQRTAHYPAIKPELVELTSALHSLAHDAELRAQYLADARAFADKYELPPDQREALIKLDLASMVKMGAHPLVPFLAQLQIAPPGPGAWPGRNPRPANRGRRGTCRRPAKRGEGARPGRQSQFG